MKPLDHIKVRASTKEGQKFIGWAKSKALAVEELMSDLGVEAYQKTIDMGDGNVLHLRKSPVGQDSVHNINIYTAEEAAELGLVPFERDEAPVFPEHEPPEFPEDPAIPVLEGFENPEPEGVPVESNFYVALEVLVTDFGQFQPSDPEVPRLVNWSTTLVDGETRWPAASGMSSCTAFWKIDSTRPTVNVRTQSPDFIVAGIGCHDWRSEDRGTHPQPIKPSAAAPRLESTVTLLNLPADEDGVFQEVQPMQLWKLDGDRLVGSNGNSMLFEADPTDTHLYPEIIRQDNINWSADDIYLRGNTRKRRKESSGTWYKPDGSILHTGHNLPIDATTNLVRLVLEGRTAERGIIFHYNNGKIKGRLNDVELSATPDVSVPDVMIDVSDMNPIEGAFQQYHRVNPPASFPIKLGTYVPNDGIVDITYWIDDAPNMPTAGDLTYYPIPGFPQSFLRMTGYRFLDLEQKHGFGYFSTTYGEAGNWNNELPTDQASVAGKWCAFPVMYDTHEGDVTALTGGVFSDDDVYVDGFDYDYVNSQAIKDYTVYNNMFDKEGFEREVVPPAELGSLNLAEVPLLDGLAVTLATGIKSSRNYGYFSLSIQGGGFSHYSFIPRTNCAPICQATRTSIWGYVSFYDGESYAQNIFYMDSSRHSFISKNERKGCRFWLVTLYNFVLDPWMGDYYRFNDPSSPAATTYQHWGMDPRSIFTTEAHSVIPNHDGSIYSNFMRDGWFPGNNSLTSPGGWWNTPWVSHWGSFGSHTPGALKFNEYLTDESDGIQTYEDWVGRTKNYGNDHRYQAGYGPDYPVGDKAYGTYQDISDVTWTNVICLQTGVTHGSVNVKLSLGLGITDGAGPSANRFQLYVALPIDTIETEEIVA